MGTGRPILEGILNFDGVGGADGSLEVGREGRLFLALPRVGIGGRAAVGGSYGGSNGIGGSGPSIVGGIIVYSAERQRRYTRQRAAN